MAFIEYKTESIRLTSKNYTNWKIVMTSLLKSKGLWEYVEDDEKPLAREEDIKKAEEAKHLLYISMEPSQITHTGICETAHELWTKIKENNGGAEISRRNNALADFLGFKHHRGETIINYCGRFELALGRLEATGYITSEDTELWVFRNSLPKEIKTTINTWALARPDGQVAELITISMFVQGHIDTKVLAELTGQRDLELIDPSTTVMNEIRYVQNDHLL